ncbi:MAG: pimeloyl-ACP methyl ester carboxylesterase [Arenicella sp.]|jgi:pimeloyl-ACP methyl ester carboxylesterase
MAPGYTGAFIVSSMIFRETMNTRSLNIRGLNHHIQEWGDSSKPLLILLHGWMDCGATYQFVSEYLVEDYFLVAPDWRGFGQTDHAQSYWFPDYFADLEKLLDHYSPNQPANLVGHSMGGNIALMYAGIQPHRVNKVLSLEALGMAPTDVSQATHQYRRWLREITSDEAAKVYQDFDALCLSVRQGNPTLTSETVVALATMWGQPFGEQGAYRLKHDHAHRYANPVRYHFDDVLEVWSEITAKVGLVMARDSSFFQRLAKFGRIDEAKTVLKIADSDYFEIKRCGHMLHIEKPQATADSILAFFK